MKGVDDAARDFVILFDRMGVPYAIMGGLAVRAHALPRPTFDVDFTISIEHEALPELYRAAETMGYVVPSAQSAGWIDRVRGLPVVKFQWIAAGRSIDIDVFLAETPFQRRLLDRRRTYEHDGLVSLLVTPEDLILLKLLADRPKDRVDVADILFIQGQLDLDYLRLWADRLRVRESLEAALGAIEG